MSAPITGDELRHRLRWGARDTVPRAAGLRFRFRHGSLYSSTLPDQPGKRR